VPPTSPDSRPDAPGTDPSVEGDLPSLRVAIRVRLRLVGSGLTVGLPGGAVAVGGAVLFGRTAPDAVALAFGLGAVALGFGVLGWSGSILAGRGIESLQQYAETGTDWTERKSRRAMTRIVGVGLGLMVTASLVEAVVG
jgi:hypothetical protein